jgi:hypothetical protein
MTSQPRDQSCTRIINKTICMPPFHRPIIRHYRWSWTDSKRYDPFICILNLGRTIHHVTTTAGRSTTHPSRFVLSRVIPRIHPLAFSPQHSLALFSRTSVPQAVLSQRRPLLPLPRIDNHDRPLLHCSSYHCPLPITRGAAGILYNITDCIYFNTQSWHLTDLPPAIAYQNDGQPHHERLFLPVYMTPDHVL